MYKAKTVDFDFNVNTAAVFDSYPIVTIRNIPNKNFKMYEDARQVPNG